MKMLQSATNSVETLRSKGVSDVLLTSKGENKAFPPPSPPCNVVPLFELPIENNKHPNFEWRRGGRVWILLLSEVTLFEYNVSTILSPIVACFLVSNGKKRRTSCLHLLSSYQARRQRKSPGDEIVLAHYHGTVRQCGRV